MSHDSDEAKNLQGGILMDQGFWLERSALWHGSYGLPLEVVQAMRYPLDISEQGDDY